MNKQEAIELLREMSKESFKLAKIHAVHIDSIVEVVNEIDEPQKVVVPKFVAEWIVEAEKIHNNLYWVWFANPVSDELNVWLKNHTETFMRAWLYGYTVEKEKLYTVEIPNPHSYIDNHSRLAKNYKGKVVLEVQDWLNTFDSYKLTEAEIKKDFDWAWQFAKEVENDTEM